jgi:hypothetical protein
MMPVPASDPPGTVGQQLFADRRPPTADRRPPTADRRPPTADRRPPTADRRGRGRGRIGVGNRVRLGLAKAQRV